jgi:PBP1b-binding outer membrane lipoprotein LpoB
VTTRQAVLAVLASAAVLSGCSASPSASPSAESAPTRNAAAEADCGDAATKVKEYVASKEISKVTVNGQCTNVTIDTNLTDDNTADGKEICEAAGKVVYTGDINSVTVRSKSGAEISTGIDGARCLP